MYNYHADVVWSVNAALAVIIFITSAAIFACLIIKDILWKARRRELLSIKQKVYEAVLAHESSSKNVCEPLVADLTPQQFIDIETNSNIDAAFFNDSEQKFFRGCYVRPEILSRLEKTASGSRNKWRRIEAILALGYTQSKSSPDILKAWLLNKDKDIAYYSMIALGQIKNAQSAGLLLELLRKDPSSGHKIVSILQNFPKDIADQVIELTNHYDPLVKYWALTLLAKLGAPGRLKQVIKLTQDPAVDVRAAACDCIGSSGSRDGAAALLACAKDDNWLVRRHAVLALGKVMGDASLPEVAKLINDASWSVLDAVRTVMTDHIEASLPYIDSFLAGKDEIAKKYSVMILESSGYLTKLLNTVISGTNKEIAGRLLKGVLKSRSRLGLDAAVSRLKPEMRAKALEALEKIEER